MKKISIIVPVYNVEKYICQCLNSILEQSYQAWEALLVDDGSLDSSGNICDAYARKDSRFKVIHKENGGAASAKNIGLDYATGDYITFIDSDDYVERKWLEVLVANAERFCADVVECQFDKVFRNRIELNLSFEEYIEEFSAEEYLNQYLSRWDSSLFCTKFVQRELIENIRFCRERRCIDDEFFTYKVITNAKRVIRINDTLYHYRQRRSSAVRNEKNQLQITKDVLDVLIERYEWICSRFSGLRKIYLSHDIGILFYFMGFRHNQDTVKMFRSVARYYLKEALFPPFHVRIIMDALRLQMISDRKLLGNISLQNEHLSMEELYE